MIDDRERRVPDLYIGLISGTSRDGIDAVVAEFGDRCLSLHASHTFAYPDALAATLERFIETPEHVSLDALGDLHAWIGEAFGDAAASIAERAGFRLNEIAAIGSHGQTIRHGPAAAHPFSLQIGVAHASLRRRGLRPSPIFEPETSRPAARAHRSSRRFMPGCLPKTRKTSRS